MKQRSTPRQNAAPAPTVLVIGRVRARVSAIQRLLERYGLPTVTLAWKATASGLWRLGALPPDAVVVDVAPPVTADHIEVLHRLRDRWEAVPQIVVTPGASASVLTSLLAVGVDDFVCGDNRSSELVVRLRRQLRRVSPRALPMPLGSETVEYDDIRRTVAANGRRITLTSREFEVFRCLVDNADTLLSREEILERVWGKSHDQLGASGIVGVYVLYLRRKLAKLGLAHALRTVKGKGYAFLAPSSYWTSVPSSATASPSASLGLGNGDLHASSTGRARGASNDDLDVPAQPEEHADQPVRREAL